MDSADEEVIKKDKDIYKVKEAATKKGVFRNERLPQRKAGIDQFSQIEMTKYRRRKRA